MGDGLEERRKTTLRELELARDELLKKCNNPNNVMELITVNGILQMTGFSIAVLESEGQHFPRWFQWIVLSILNPWTGSGYRKFLKVQQRLEDFGEDTLLIDEEYELVGEGSQETDDISSRSENDSASKGGPYVG